MAMLAERLAAIQVRATVPGTEIEARLSNRTDVTLSFGPDDYATIDERTMQRYLARLARQLYVEYVREYRLAIEDSAIVLDAPRTERDEAFIRDRDELAAEGGSADGRVGITTVGMRDVKVHLAPGTLRELSERRFIAAVHDAVAALAADYQAKIDELKQRIYQ